MPFQIIPESVLPQQLLGNSLASYTSALIILIGAFVIFKIFHAIILSRLHKLSKKTHNDIDDLFTKIISSVRPPFYAFLSFYIAFLLLTIHQTLQQIINAILIIWVTYQVISASQLLITYIANKATKDEDGAGTSSAVHLLTIVAKIILWTLGILMILSNIGVNITSLIAGLGIGGIAIALALQNILSDLFSSFAIYFDKPFAIGDFIVVGDHKGVVEKIGIKTTRIRALQGEEIVISNQELTSTRVRNFKQMKERRVIINFGVIYETPQEKLKQIPSIVKEIINSVPGVRFDRAHFNKFGDFALEFEVVYYVRSGDYNEYMDQNEEIHYKIKDQFEAEKLSMAYPTQTLHVTKTK